MNNKKQLFISFFISSCCCILNSHSQVLTLRSDQVISPDDLAIQKKWVAYNKNKNEIRQNENLYTIPIVFHIIHQNGPENLSDNVVIEVFQKLNDAFANSGFYDQGSGVDTKIQFCLAKKDPDRNFTTGITHTYADLPLVNPAIHTALLESLIKWDPQKYFNVWIVKEVDLAIEFNRCGYGDLMAAGYGGNGHVVASAANLQSIIVHEAGHALGLSHTFEGWCVNNNCLTDGDGICDTPPEQTISITGGCSSPENSCFSDTQSGFSTDQNDLKTNHMDYGNQSCQHDFTQGQKEKMRFVIETQFPGWLTGDACNNDCTSPATASFSFPTATEYSIGNTISFTNTSTAASAYEWSVNNVVQTNSIDFTYTFPGQGWYKISLLATPSPDETKCRNKQVNWIRVYCAVKTIVSADKRKASVGGPVQFNAIVLPIVNMPEQIQYEWYYNNILFGNSASFTYSFTTPGEKIFYLITIRGACRDTSLAKMIDIKELPDFTINLDKLICLNNKPGKLSFSVCNNGHFDLPPGLPISFYFKNPTNSAAPLAAMFVTPEAISQYCCKDFEIDLPTGSNANFIYAVINDNHTNIPPYNLAIDFPVTTFFEKLYTNNLDSLSLNKFSVTISPQVIIIPVGSSINLSAAASEPASLIWNADYGNFTCDTCVSTAFSTKQFSRVIVKATTSGGCAAFDTVFVKILANGEVFIPTGFTPNKDRLNDYFFVLGGESVSKVRSMLVFNRWGELVFKNKDVMPNFPYAGWDGRINGYPAIPGVYVYLVTVEFVNGISRKYKGTLSLIR